MKIDKVNEGNYKKPEPIAPLFAPALNDRISKVTDPALRQVLGLLIADVEDKGKKLYSSKGRKEFEAYKGSVKAFMHKVVNSSFRLEEKHGRKKDGKFVVYLTMEKVDEALEGLAHLLLAGQQDSMRILATLDEIRGMLMDLYL
jgi:uncharacterized protein YaaR (DUF327 family)